MVRLSRLLAFVGFLALWPDGYTHAAPPAVSPGAGAETGPSSTAVTEQERLPLIRQLLEVPVENTVNPATFDVTISRWQKRYWVVFVRVLKDERASRAALGLYADGEKPVPARKLASSGPLEAKEPMSFERLDLANFRVTKTEVALGVWLKRRTAYAGGFGEADVLELFMRRGTDLSSIFSTAMRYDCDLAGDWNEDGSRDRTEASGESVLVVSKNKTDGYFDLVQRSGKTVIEIFQWSGNGYTGSIPLEKRRRHDAWGNDCEVTEIHD